MLYLIINKFSSPCRKICWKHKFDLTFITANQFHKILVLISSFPALNYKRPLARFLSKIIRLSIWHNDSLKKTKSTWFSFTSNLDSNYVDSYSFTLWQYNSNQRIVIYPFVIWKFNFSPAYESRKSFLNLRNLNLFERILFVFSCNTATADVDNPSYTL